MKDRRKVQEWMEGIGWKGSMKDRRKEGLGMDGRIDEGQKEGRFMEDGRDRRFMEWMDGIDP